MSGKRAFPFYSEVQGFELQRRRLEEDPSRRVPGAGAASGSSGGGASGTLLCRPALPLLTHAHHNLQGKGGS